MPRYHTLIRMWETLGICAASFAAWSMRCILWDVGLPLGRCYLCTGVHCVLCHTTRFVAVLRVTREGSGWVWGCVLVAPRSGNEEAGLYAREAAFLLLRHMYSAVPPPDIKDRVLGGIGGNAVRAPWLLSKP